VIHPELLEILCCPESRQPVRPASEEEKERVNQAIRDGRISGVSEVREALIREDGRFLYPIRDGIPIMLIEDRIEAPEPWIKT